VTVDPLNMDYLDKKYNNYNNNNNSNNLMPRCYVTLLRLSWKRYELFTRYHGYPVPAISTFEALVHQSNTVCSESRDFSFARSVTR
jgi:hypothetical protein